MGIACCHTYIVSLKLLPAKRIFLGNFQIFDSQSHLVVDKAGSLIYSLGFPTEGWPSG